MTTTTPPTPLGDTENQSLLGKLLGYSPKMKILDFLLDFPTNDFTKKGIIEALGMSKQTFYKYFDDLEEIGIVKVNRTIGKAKLYKVDQDNPVVKELSGIERKLSLQISEKEAGELPEEVAVPEPKRTKRSSVSVYGIKQSHDSSIVKRAKRLQTSGWKVRADVTGFKRPTYLRIGETKMRPDIVARKGKVTRIIEIKSSNRSQNANLLKKYAKENKNVELLVEDLKVSR